MRRPAPLLPVLLLGLALSASAASELDALRKELSSARREAASLREEQGQLRSELNSVSASIQALKEGKQGVARRGELDAQLKRSQELSGQLTLLAGQLEAVDGRVATSAQSLLQALSEELAQATAEFDRATSRAQRAQAARALKQLRDEREALAPLLPKGSLPTLPPETRSEDPEALLEQADALRDAEDKARRQLKQVQARAQELRAERELERRMLDFQREEGAFDDRDRSFQGGPAGPARGMQAQHDTTVVEQAPGEFFSGGGVSGGTARPDVGPTGGGRALPDDELESLERRAAELKALSEELLRRAKAVEARARDGR